MYIFAWNNHSEGAKALKDAMGIKKIKNENSKFKGGPNKIVINWGSSELPSEILKCRIINKPNVVSRCSNKLSFFKHLQKTEKDILPPWTETLEEALDWVTKGHTVCARTLLQGHSAEGLVLMTKNDPTSFVRARLYTQYVKKQEEYRVHVVRDEVIDYQRKVLSREKADSGEEVNWKVRNYANGFIYQRGGVNPRDCVLEASLKTIRASGLDFGAVDVIYSEKKDKAYVLEVNTAPGLQGQTVQSYANALRRL